ADMTRVDPAHARTHMPPSGVQQATSVGTSFRPTTTMTTARATPVTSAAAAGGPAAQRVDAGAAAPVPASSAAPSRPAEFAASRPATLPPQPIVTQARTAAPESQGSRSAAADNPESP